MKKIAIALSVALLATTVFVLIGGDEGLREMTIKRLRGDVTVLRGGDEIAVSDETGIEPGDRIVTGFEGRAELRLMGERRVELGPRSTAEVTGIASVDGLGGSLLGSSSDRDDLTVGFGGVETSTTDGLFRVDLGTGSSRVGVYEGRASISSPGESDASVGRYFQVGVAGNERVLQPAPLAIDEADAWDQIHLGDVLDLDARITKLGNGLATQLGGARPGVEYFAGLTTEPVGFIRPYLGGERVSDLLIGFTVARNSGASLESSFARSIEYRADGGRWGVIARIMSAPERKLVAQLGRTIVGTGILAAETDAEPGFGVSAEGAGTTTAGGAATTTTTTQGSGPPGDDGGGSGGAGGGEGSPPSGGGGGGGGGENPEPGPSPPPDEGGCGPDNPTACLDDPPIGDGGLLEDGAGTLLP